MKTVLYHCLSGLDNLKPERVSDHKSILLRLHTLVSFTSPGTWAIQKVKGMDQLKTGMSQLCANIMGHLVNNGFYTTMQVITVKRDFLMFLILLTILSYSLFQTLLMKGLGRAKIALKPVTLSAAVTLTLRPLISSQMSDKLVSLFLINIFSVPALVYHLNVLSPEVKEKKENIFKLHYTLWYLLSNLSM